MAYTALVTGANRGIGLEVCRQLLEVGLSVVLTARDPKRGREAVRILGEHGARLRFEPLDVGSGPSVEACRQRLRDVGIDVDVVVNNAAIYPQDPLVGHPLQVWEDTLRINLTGAFLMCEAFVPGMLERSYGRVVNVSSGSGSFCEGMNGPPAYCVSKAALNALTVKLAQRVADAPDVKVNAVCPGWVRTDMGGADATRSIPQGAKGIVRLATLADDGPSGCFFRDDRRIEW